MLSDDLVEVKAQLRQALDELQSVAQLDSDQILVVGASTSEVIGKKIGTAGSQEVAAAIVEAVLEARETYGFHVAFQCCEHLNRALVVERETVKAFRLEEVTVVPVPGAGGAVASTAYRKLNRPAIVETIQAHAGIDVGDTFIGMHLRPVAVPVRPSVRQIGNAHLTMARTRPKLIGGARAVYVLEE
jgi:uncharacterized protein (TIGR01440 family)